ncbi:MAG: pentapeptide repeat-containing protein [Hyphomicrobiales bacterium]|nr:pentapeptide repeat-containing protein [Hyphomicrobiales bacterium]
MTRDETIALFLQGREAWNAWAEGMLAERKRLEDAGLWGEGDASNQKAKTWMEQATADYSKVIFFNHDCIIDWENPRLSKIQTFIDKPRPEFKTLQSTGNFSGWVFPWNVSFANSYFACILTFQETKVFGSTDFSGSYFLLDIWFSKSEIFRECYFISSEFYGEVRFNQNSLRGLLFFNQSDSRGDFVFTKNNCYAEVLFNQTKFRAPAGFLSNTFQNNVQLYKVIFQNWVEFKESSFEKGVIFEDAVFQGAAKFVSVNFSEVGGKADFFQATFKRFATFRDAHFHRDARFTAISAERAFDLRGAQFDTLPDFTQANFREAPHLDNLKLGDTVEPGGFWRPVPGDAEADAVANHRSLRRLAIQAHDHANEQKFLRGEIRARRGNEDKPWHAAYWMGVLYDAVSDFGRSIARPFWLWALSAKGFAPGQCANGPGAPILDALYLAYKNALLVIGWESEQKLNAVHECLYGAAQAPSGVALIQLGQNLVSAVLLFLLLLGVRNRFKIK